MREEQSHGNSSLGSYLRTLVKRPIETNVSNKRHPQKNMGIQDQRVKVTKQLP